MEQRIARLEGTVEHIQSDITEMKADIRRLDTKIDGVKDSVAVLTVHMEKSFAAVNQSIATLALSTERSISGLTRWGIALYIGLVAGLVTAFMWIAERLPPVQ